MLGRFITFEGGEGTGKSTQSRMLAEALQKRGLTVVQTREPGGTSGAEAIRNLLLDPNGNGWDAEAEALLFAAARADHVQRVIRPAVDKGNWVICDRFLDSSRAYQGGEGSISDKDVLKLHAIGSQNYLPHLTILIEVSPEITAARLNERDGKNSDRIGGREAEYHANVAKRFREMAKAEPERFCIVSGEGTPQQVQEQIFSAISDRLELPS